MTTLVEPVHMVVSAVILGGPIHAPEVLLTQRHCNSDFAGHWELPGGKVESSETRAEAMCRELHEEIGVTVAEVGDPIFVWHIRTTKLYRVHFLPVRLLDKSPRAQCLQVQGLGWFKLPLPAGLPIMPSMVAGQAAVLQYAMNYARPF